MKKLFASLLLLGAAACVLLAFASCKDDDSYSELRKRERRTISHFIKNGTVQLNADGDTLLVVRPIKVISESQFQAQDSTTRLDENEYVHLKASGVYLQIVNPGVGEKMKNGDNMTILSRHIEMNLRGDTIQTGNNNLYYIAMPNVMTVNDTYGTFTGSFVSGVMYSTYGAAVPRGWLVAFPYIRVGRQAAEGEQIAKVRVIVPSEQGQRDASGEVYACFYEITFQKGY